MTRSNKSQLFNSSEDIFGNPTGFYSLTTEILSGGKKKAGDPYNFFDTGLFLKSLFAKKDGNSIVFGSSDPKTKLILSNRRLLSNELFGLNDENLRVVIREELLPMYLKFIRKELEI